METPGTTVRSNASTPAGVAEPGRSSGFVSHAVAELVVIVDKSILHAYEAMARQECHPAVVKRISPLTWLRTQVTDLYLPRLMARMAFVDAVFGIVFIVPRPR
jgi:hypothetical protein